MYEPARFAGFIDSSGFRRRLAAALSKEVFRRSWQVDNALFALAFGAVHAIGISISLIYAEVQPTGLLLRDYTSLELMYHFDPRTAFERLPLRIHFHAVRIS